MVIGVDCSRAFGKNKTGTENYSWYVITHMLRLPEAKAYQFILFIRAKTIVPRWIEQLENVKVVSLNYRYLWTQVGLALASWRERLDVLWVPAHTLPIFRRRLMKTVVTIHGLEYQWLPEYQNWLQRWYLPLSTIYASKQADSLIAVSKFTKKQLVEQFHTTSKKIKVIYEGVEKENGEYGMQNSEWREKYILFVGTLMPRKNLPALIKAMSLLDKKWREYKLVIVGKKGWMTEDIFQSVVKYGVEDKIVFKGRISNRELSMLYREAELYIQPSWTEGFGLPVLEAMRFGVPVISSDGGALPEVVGSAGLIVRLGSGFERKLAKQIGRVLSDGELRDKLKKKGLEQVKRFGWKKTAQESLKVLVDIVN